MFASPGSGGLDGPRPEPLASIGEGGATSTPLERSGEQRGHGASVDGKGVPQMMQGTGAAGSETAGVEGKVAAAREGLPTTAGEGFTEGSEARGGPDDPISPGMAVDPDTFDARGRSPAESVELEAGVDFPVFVDTEPSSATSPVPSSGAFPPSFLVVRRRTRTTATTATAAPTPPMIA